MDVTVTDVVSPEWIVVIAGCEGEDGSVLVEPGVVLEVFQGDEEVAPAAAEVVEAREVATDEAAPASASVAAWHERAEGESEDESENGCVGVSPKLSTARAATTAASTVNVNDRVATPPAGAVACAGPDGSGCADESEDGDP